MKVEDHIQAILSSAASALSTGELCMEVSKRLTKGVQIRITPAGVRVTHSHYIDRLSSPESIDAALEKNSFEL